MHTRKDEKFAHIINSCLSSSSNTKFVHPNRFDGYISDRASSNNIWLLSRFIEHINKKEYLDELISRIDIGELAVIEMLDFKALFRQLTASFLWDERIYYPTKEFVRKFFLSKGFVILETYIDSHSEPFFVFVLKRISLIQSHTSCQSSTLPEPDIVSTTYFRFIDCCRQQLSKYRSFSFYGVNHKAFLWHPY